MDWPKKNNQLTFNFFTFDAEPARRNTPWTVWNISSDNSRIATFWSFYGDNRKSEHSFS